MTLAINSRHLRAQREGAGLRHLSRRLFNPESNASVQIGRVALIAAILALWEFGARRWFDPFFFSQPSAVAARFVKEIMDPSFYYDLYITGVEMIAGYAGGGLAGIVLGVLLARWQYVAKLFDPLLLALNSVPRIAVAPMLIVWFGIDMASKIFLSATLVFFITFFNTVSGVRSVERALCDVAKVQGATDWQIFSKVVLPSASSWIITGLKMSLPFALVGVILGEFLVSSKGLGYRLNQFSTSYDTTGAITMILLMMVIMMLMTAIVDYAEGRVLKWRPKTTTDTIPRA